MSIHCGDGVIGDSLSNAETSVKRNNRVGRGGGRRLYCTFPKLKDLLHVDARLYLTSFWPAVVEYHRISDNAVRRKRPLPAASADSLQLVHSPSLSTIVILIQPFASSTP